MPTANTGQIRTGFSKICAAPRTFLCQREVRLIQYDSIISVNIGLSRFRYVSLQSVSSVAQFRNCAMALRALLTACSARRLES